MSDAELSRLFSLEGKVAVVTGASSGLGEQAARAMVRGGASVGLVARRKERLDQLASELGKLGARTCSAAADLTRSEESSAALDRVEAELGPIDILVNGAGIAPLGRAENHEREKWDAAISVNLSAAFELSQLVARRLIEREVGGRIIHISSVIGSGGNPVHRAVGYAASKGGLDNMVRHLAIEWSRYEITVNAVAPSYFPTEMTIDPDLGDVAPDQKARMESFTPMARLGREGELDTALLFLAAPASTYVTGVILPVDGGWTAW